MDIYLPLTVGSTVLKLLSASGPRSVRFCGDVAQLVMHRIGTLPTPVRFSCAAVFFFFFLQSTSSADSLTVSVHALCSVACIDICAHVKDPVVHVRVRWIMETLKELLA